MIYAYKGYSILLLVPLYSCSGDGECFAKHKAERHWWYLCALEIWLVVVCGFVVCGVWLSSGSGFEVWLRLLLLLWRC